MGNDLGVKALVEFEARGQREVLDATERMQSGLGGLGTTLRNSLGAAGITLGLQQIISAIRQAGTEVGQWAEAFSAANLQAADAVDRLRSRMKELNGEEERTRIGTEITAKIRGLKRELADLNFNELNEGWTTAAWDGLKNGVAGFDLDQSQIKRVYGELQQMEALKKSLAAQPLKKSGEKGQSGTDEDWAALNEQMLRAKRDLDLSDAMRALKDPATGELEKTVLTDNIIGNLQAEVDKVNEARQSLTERLEKAVTAGLYDDAKKLTAMLADKMAELDQLNGTISDLQKKEEPKSAKDPSLDIKFDRLTKVGFTLGDPAGLKGPGQASRGKDPTFYMERANQVAEKMLAIMEENRRRNYTEEAAYAD